MGLVLAEQGRAGLIQAADGDQSPPIGGGGEVRGRLPSIAGDAQVLECPLPGIRLLVQECLGARVRRGAFTGQSQSPRLQKAKTPSKGARGDTTTHPMVERGDTLH